jgi:hypothetical protein
MEAADFLGRNLSGTAGDFAVDLLVGGAEPARRWYGIETAKE